MEDYMSKKFSFDFVPFTYEELKSMSNDELQMNLSKFRRFIKEARRSNMETHSFEIELCYLDNERQARARTEKFGRNRR